MQVKVLCPAKINLFLSVGKIDHRGYHPIRTIFQAISLYDTLTLTVADSLSFTCDSTDVPSENTVTKAARLMQEIADYPPVAIHLEKCIPTQSGMGGGSSDAAGVIQSASQFMSMRLSDHERKAIAKSIGADVPFFLVGGRAKGEGYGEKLTPLLSPSTPEWYVIAQPQDRCSTGDTFAKLDALEYEWLPFPTSDTLYNDFERVAPCGSLELIEQILSRGARDAGLTGSGSAVFGRFPDQQSANLAATQLEKLAPFVRVAHSL